MTCKIESGLYLKRILFPRTTTHFPRLSSPRLSWIPPFSSVVPISIFSSHPVSGHRGRNLTTLEYMRDAVRYKQHSHRQLAPFKSAKETRNPGELSHPEMPIAMSPSRSCQRPVSRWEEMLSNSTDNTSSRHTSDDRPYITKNSSATLACNAFKGLPG